MKRYSEYKDSGVKWIGEIPGHWDLLRAKNIFERQFRPVRDCDEVVTCFRDGQVTLRKNRRVEGFTESLKEIGYQGIRKGDLVIHQMDAFAGSIGVSDSDGKGTPVYICCLPKDSNNVNVYFYAYLLREMARSGFIKSLYRGIRERSSDFRFDTFAVQWLLLVPIEEQQEIVTYLDSKVAKIDEYISIAEKKIAALEELKQTIIAEAVTRGIHKDVPMKDSGVKWIGMIPEHWDLIRAQNMVDCRKAGAWGEDSRKDERDRVCLRIADFDYSICRFKRTGDYTIRNYKQEQISSLYLNKGDILIEKSGGGEKTPVGRAILYDLDFYQPLYANFMEKITLREFASSSFYVYLLRTFYAKGCVWKYIKQTTGLQNLDLRAMLGSETFPVPPLPEQQEIVTYIEAKVANINQLCQAERSQIEKLKEYKQRLISDVVTGKVKVTND